MSEPNVGSVIQLYMSLRDKKAEIEGSVKDRVKAINDKMVLLEAWIKQQADTQGVSSFKTPHGTAFLTTTEYANVADWDAVLDFVKEHDAYDMLIRNVNKKAVRAHIDATGTVPKGVTFGTKIDVNVRRPAAD